MAKKADFTEDEWKLLISTPRYILLALRSADKTGVIAARSEEKALSDYLEAYTTRSPLVRAVLAEQESVSSRLRPKEPVEYVQRAGKLLNEKANDSSGDSLRTMLLGSADAIAKAVRESRRRDADSVTNNEEAMLDTIAQALNKETKTSNTKPTAKRTRSRTKPAESAEAQDEAPATPRRTSRGGTGVRRRSSTAAPSDTNRPTWSRTKKATPLPDSEPAPKLEESAPPPQPEKPAPKAKKTVRKAKTSKPKPAPSVEEKAAATASKSPEHVTRPISDATITTRWTNVYAAPQPDSALDAGIAPNTEVEVLGRDKWSGWVLVETADVSGWVPRDALNLDSAEGLTLAWGDEAAPKTVAAPQSAEPEVVETMTITRWTNLFADADGSSATDVALEPGTRVVLLGATGAWIKVRYDEREGWIPTDALT